MEDGVKAVMKCIWAHLVTLTKSIFLDTLKLLDYFHIFFFHNWINKAVVRGEYGSQNYVFLQHWV